MSQSRQADPGRTPPRGTRVGTASTLLPALACAALALLLATASPGAADPGATEGSGRNAPPAGKRLTLGTDSLRVIKRGGYRKRDVVPGLSYHPPRSPAPAKRRNKDILILHARKPEDKAPATYRVEQHTAMYPRCRVNCFPHQRPGRYHYPAHHHPGRQPYRQHTLPRPARERRSRARSAAAYDAYPRRRDSFPASVYDPYPRDRNGNRYLLDYRHPGYVHPRPYR